jgi:hypothetical protein
LTECARSTRPYAPELVEDGDPMSTTPTMSSEPTVLEPSGATITRTDETTETDDGPVAHIVKTKPGEDAAAKVLAARIEGTPLEALCGHTWVPSRDPKQLPVCQRCKDVYGMYRDFNDGLEETPRM